MSKHTPGPWKLEVKDQARVYGADGFCVLAIPVDDDDYGRPKEEMANALLIAQAPTMLEMLKEIECYYAGNIRGNSLESLRSIIAKAEGREP